MTTTRLTLGLILAALVLAATTPALAQAPEPVTKAEFDRWMQEISNWGRWGEDDELGTLNLVTAQKTLAATKLVREGTTVSMALDLNKVQDAVNANPFRHTLSVSTFSGHQVAGDEYSVQYHGFAHSHLDGLPHFIHKGKMYNGFPMSGLKPDGAEHLGIHNFKNGIVTRGVLVDMPWVRGVDFLEPGTALTRADYEAFERKSGIRISSGDVVLVRTGRWEGVRQQGQSNFLARAAGSHASLAKFFKERDVAVIGCDGVSDVMPSGVEGLANPLHELVLVGLGLPILDNLDLEAVSKAAQERNRFEFLFVGAPLRVPGGTGSPLNPLAVF
ncbi:MAG: cyclase family protein [Acidobacteriota bacterium]|nr:cyclase family protein [Acidobacteriota bacterium]